MLNLNGLTGLYSNKTASSTRHCNNKNLRKKKVELCVNTRGAR